MRKIAITLYLLCMVDSIFAQNTTPRNSFILESNVIATTSLTYNRLIPIKERMGILAGGGFIFGTGFGAGSNWAVVETSILSFGSKHYLETGIFYAIGINDESSPGLKVAYRYIGSKGITFRASTSILFNMDPPILPALGIGYSF